MALYQHILVPVDDSPVAYGAAEHARELAAAIGAKVTFMSVVAVDPFYGIDFYVVAPAITDYFMQAEKNALLRLEDLKQTLAQDGIEVDSKIIHGKTPAEGILQIANEANADLIMMGSHKRDGFEKLVLGSVAQQVLNQAMIPVLIIKQK
jgi:nucleotide-binding universal stress UspA family protein